MHGFGKKVGKAEERIVKLNDRTLQLPNSNRKEKTFVKKKKTKKEPKGFVVLPTCQQKTYNFWHDHFKNKQRKKKRW